jgi:hypothetical protein
MPTSVTQSQSNSPEIVERRRREVKAHTASQCTASSL